MTQYTKYKGGGGYNYLRNMSTNAAIAADAGSLPLSMITKEVLAQHNITDMSVSEAKQLLIEIIGSTEAHHVGKPPRIEDFYSIAELTDEDNKEEVREHLSYIRKNRKEEAILRKEAKTKDFILVRFTCPSGKAYLDICR